jgi:1,4-alpha-glucan branching enzyme
VKKILLYALLVQAVCRISTGQIITTDPPIPVAGQAVTVYYDATLGTAGLKDYTGDVYAHTGVLTEESLGTNDWKYVKAGWNENIPEAKMTRVSANLYSLEIAPTIRDYYGVPETETITHMAFVFRSADSSLEGKDDGGKDIFVEVFEEGFNVNILIPDRNRVVDAGSVLYLEAVASEVSEMALLLNGSEVKTLTGSSLSHTFNLDTPGDYWMKVTASTGEESDADSVFVHVMEQQAEEPLPEGLEDGINYVDDRTVQLVLYAPGKEYVFVVGDFNSWIPRSSARMKKDGDRFWITLENLSPGTEYAYQYLVDGELYIADPYTEKVLDPWNDRWISEDTYPGLKPYPAAYATGIVSVLETAQEEYAWSVSDFDRPAATDLVIYELLVRDFIAAHDWKTMTDTLDYFTNLGTNAIELMPVNEFEGNESWGYNPSFYFAPDKYYGPAGDLKVFIDSCHARGIAVIIDMVLNHSYGQSPLVQLYFDPATGKVTEDNPWYNVDSPNPVYSWGYDFNQESQATQEFVDRVNRFWIEKYRVDGFRFDFTKGFTNTPGNGEDYDAARIAILERMAGRIWSVDPGTFVILEHLGPNTEEKELAAYGMMLWGKCNYNYNEATMGYNEGGKSDFSLVSYLDRGWSEPNLVGYMESHDEERLMYKNLTYGNSSDNYDIKELSTALERMELAGAFFFTIPGPKMIWQFGELGYDYSIDYICRICNKPIRWDYYDVGKRRKLYQVWSALIGLRTSEPAFESVDFSLYVSESAKRVEINHADMDVRIIGNFDVVELSCDPSFSRTGWWYDFFSGDSLNVSDLHADIPLEPGRFRVYTTRRLAQPEITAAVPQAESSGSTFRVYPNPVRDILHLEPLREPSLITITGMEGREVMVARIREGQGEVDLSALPGGCYVISRQVPGTPPAFAKILKIATR